MLVQGIFYELDDPDLLGTIACPAVAFNFSGAIPYAVFEIKVVMIQRF